MLGWKLMLCRINIVCGKICYATKNDLPHYFVLQQNMHYKYTINKHGIVSRFRVIKPQHIDFSLNIINKNNIKHPISWRMFS